MQLKRISSEAEKDAEAQKRKNRTKYIGLALLFIMAVSSIGYAFISSEKDTSGSSSAKEGIYEENGQWIVNQGNLHLTLNSGPDEARNISSNLNLTLNNLAGQTLYVADSQGYLLALLRQYIGNYVGMQEACYGSCEQDLPEKSCSGSDYVIIWDREGDKKIEQRGKCIFVNGDVSAVEAFVYRMYGII